MSKDNNYRSSGGGVSFAGLLTILFIGLKLTGHIDWSWWMVTSPIWITLCCIIAVLAVVGLIGLVIKILNSK